MTSLMECQFATLTDKWHKKKIQKFMLLGLSSLMKLSENEGG